MTRSSTTSGELAKPQYGDLRAGVGRRVARPHDGAAAGVERVQDSGRAECVDAAVAEGRRPARTGAAIRLPEPGRVAVFPHRLAGGQLVAGDDLVVTALLLGVEEVAADRERRPARSDRPAPQLDRRRLRPVGLDPHAANDAVAIGSAKAGPVGSCLRCRNRQPAFQVSPRLSDLRLAPPVQSALEPSPGWVLPRPALPEPTEAPPARRRLGPGAVPRESATSARRSPNRHPPVMPPVRTQCPQPSARQQDGRDHRGAPRSGQRGDGWPPPRRRGRGSRPGWRRPENIIPIIPVAIDL